MDCARAAHRVELDMQNPELDNGNQKVTEIDAWLDAWEARERGIKARSV